MVAGKKESACPGHASPACSESRFRLFSEIAPVALNGITIAVLDLGAMGFPGSVPLGSRLFATPVKHVFGATGCGKSMHRQFIYPPKSRERGSTAAGKLQMPYLFMRGLALAHPYVEHISGELAGTFISIY